MNQMEQTNYNTFSSSLAQKEYDKSYLKDYEKIVLKKYFRPGMKVLDLGCGAGRTTQFIKDFGCEVIGVDISRELIDLAKVRYPNIDFRVGNAAALDFSPDCFDIVFFSFNGIDYLYPRERRLAAVGDIGRVLKKGGLFIYSSHNKFNLPRNGFAVKTFLENIFTLKIFGDYRLERHAMGDLVTYYGSVQSENSDLKKKNFLLLEAIGVGRFRKIKNRFLLSFFSKHIMYIAKKS